MCVARCGSLENVFLGLPGERGPGLPGGNVGATKVGVCSLATASDGFDQSAGSSGHFQ